MCDSCKAAGFESQHAQAANVYLDVIAEYIAYFDENGTYGREAEKKFNEFDALISKLDLLCMEHIGGAVHTPTQEEKGW